MGRIAEVISFARRVIRGVPVTSVRMDAGDGATSSADQCGPSGDDAPPLPGDFVHSSKSESGGEQVVGYHDPKNAGKAAGGEKRVYARDPSGEVVGEIWLKGDGTLRIETTATVYVDAPDVRLGDGSSTVATAGDVCVTVSPLLQCGGVPCLPVNPKAASVNGYIGSGRILGRQSKVRA